MSKTATKKAAAKNTKRTTKKKISAAKDKERQKAKFLTVYAKKDAIVSHAVKAAGICRNTFYEWKKADPDFKSKCEEIEDSVGDWVEEAIHAKMKVQKDTTMLIFYAKTKLKNRGYIERTEQVTFDGNVKVKVPGEELPEFKDED
jgi:hypothetical protein